MIRLVPLDRQRIRSVQHRDRWALAPALAVTLALALVLARGGGAAAQDGGAGLLPETDEASPDPLGTGGTGSLRTVRITAPDVPAPVRGPVPPSLEPRAGEVLAAAPGLRELEHRVHVELVDGLARVSVALRFANRGRHAAELRYRLAAPPGATLAGLEVCQAESCQEGRLAIAGAAHVYEDAVRSRGPEGRGPVAWARWLIDERGEAFVVRAAPVPARGSLTVMIRYLADAPLRGGVARLVLPARGTDPRAAPTTITAVAPDLFAATVEGGPAEEIPATVEAWFEVEVMAQAGAGQAPALSVTRFPCGESTCARVYEAAGPVRGQPRDLVLLIDGSPSTEGPARGRIAPAVAAVLGAAPRGTRVRAVVFGARARALVERAMEPALVPMAPIVSATTMELGSATRFEAAWALAGPWLRQREPRSPRPLLVIVGDGGLSTSDEGAAAFRAARGARVPVSVFNVADRSVAGALATASEHSRGRVIDAGPAAELAIRGRGTARLEERAAALFAPRLRRGRRVRGTDAGRLAPLWAGEQVAWEGPLVRRRVSVAGRRVRPVSAEPRWANGLAARAVGRAESRRWAYFVGTGDDEPSPEALVCADHGPERSSFGVSRDATPIIPASARACAAPPSPAATSTQGRGMPAETVLAMLRQRVMPVARGCFRQDRAGRLDYSTRAELHIRMADREIVAASVLGSITPRLRSCLMAALATLEVPRFRGSVLVRYPLRTERADRAPTIELTREAAERVDGVLGRRSPGPD